jgi:hypothetical protein
MMGERGALAAPVAVVSQSFIGTALPEGYLQGLGCQKTAQNWLHCPADCPPGAKVQDRRQVKPAFVCRNVSGVRCQVHVWVSTAKSRSKTFSNVGNFGSETVVRGRARPGLFALRLDFRISQATLFSPHQMPFARSWRQMCGLPYV